MVSCNAEGDGVDRAWIADVFESGVREKFEIIRHVIQKWRGVCCLAFHEMMCPACCCTSGGGDGCVSKSSGKESSVLND